MWVASWLIVVELPALAMIVQLFPSGRPLPGWHGYLIASVLAGVLGVLAAATEALPGSSGPIVDAAGMVAVPLLAFAGIGGVLPLAMRRRRTEGAEQRAVGGLILVMAAGVIVPGLVAVGGSSGEVAAQIFTVAQLGFISAVVLRHRVWGVTAMTRGSLMRVVAATDAERRRIRADLHDGVGAGITAIRLKVDAAHQLVASRPDRAVEMLDSASSDLGSVLEEVRAMVEGLRPAVLDRFGLAGALELRARELSTHSPDLAITVRGGTHFDAIGGGVDVAIYRVVSEALNNVVRHSNASHCDVAARIRGDDLVIDVVDDGDVDLGDAPTGAGLSSMSVRAAAVGGYLVTGIERGRGYRVQLVIPKSSMTESTG